MKTGLKKNAFSILAFLGLIWLVHVINLPLIAAGYDLRSYGVRPRTVPGLAGIPLMTFLHEDFAHLIANTIPLAVLLMMLAVTRQHPLRIIVGLVLLSGTMLWLLGRDKIHTGSSALIFAMAAYLIAAGFLERRTVPIAAAILVAVLYGNFFWKMLPTAGAAVSWEGHLLAAASGAALAWLTLKRKKPAQPALDSPNTGGPGPSPSA